MKGIGDLLNESEQLRVETDDNGPQVLFLLLGKVLDSVIVCANLIYIQW